MTTKPALEERPDGLGLHDAHGARRGDEPPVAAPRVLGQDPAVARPVTRRLLGGVAPADGLRRVLEGGVLGIHDGLGQDAHDAVGHAAPSQLAHEGVAEEVADAAFGIGHAHVEREPRGEIGLGDDLGAAEDEADLRAVAVGQDDAPAVGDERAHVRGRRARVLELLGDGALLPARISALPPTAMTAVRSGRVTARLSAGGRARGARRRSRRAAPSRCRRRSGRCPPRGARCPC